MTGVLFLTAQIQPPSKFGQLSVMYNLGGRLFLPLSASGSKMLGIVMWPQLDQSGSPAGTASGASGSMSGD